MPIEEVPKLVAGASILEVVVSEGGRADGVAGSTAASLRPSALDISSAINDASSTLAGTASFKAASNARLASVLSSSDLLAAFNLSLAFSALLPEPRAVMSSRVRAPAVDVEVGGGDLSEKSHE